MKSIYRNIGYIVLLLMCIQLSFASSGNIFRSLLLPGWGEMKMNYNKRAKIFFTSEIIILGTHFLGKSFNKSYIDQYTGFAELHAGVDMDERDYEFIIDMSNHNSMTEYNHYMAIHHYQDPEQFQYNPDTEDWNWDSTESRLKFDKLRRDSLVAEMVADFALAGLIVNRIVSVIDVMYLRKKNSKISMNSHIVPIGDDGVSLNISFSLK